MLLREVLDLVPLFDNPSASGQRVADFLKNQGSEHVEFYTVTGGEGSTDFISVTIPGRSGKLSGGNAPTLGIIGRLGGIGARPEQIGFVSDGDGALAAVAAALKLVRMNLAGDGLEGDVIVRTHICPNAPTKPHKPVPFMGSPVDSVVMNQNEVDSKMDAIISIDTTKGNKVLNNRGIAITPTVKEGYILKICPKLVDLLQQVTGQKAMVLPLTTQDITPYGNGIYHINSILQPATATESPVIGLAITTEVPVAGCATGASHEVDIAMAAKYSIEVAKVFGAGELDFYDKDEYERLIKLYGKMIHLQTQGNN